MKRIQLLIITCLIGFCASAQSPMLGEIRVIAGNAIPEGWALCNGQTLSIATHSYLYTIIGTTYGGDGLSTFAVPNLCGRVPMGAGQGTGLSSYSTGSKGGSTTITYTTANLPSHTHTVTTKNSNDAANADTPSGTLPASTSSNAYAASADGSMASGSLSESFSSEGSGATQNNMQPYLGLKYIIALNGYYQAADEPYIGEIRMYAGSTIPSGWHACDGSSLTTAYYQSVYALIGTIYGGTATTFKLPDLRSRIPISYGTNSSVTYTIGGAGGEESQTLTTDQMAAHSHIVATTSKVYNGIGDSDTPIGNYPAINPQRGNEFTTTSSSTTSSTETSGATGSGTAVSNVQPYCTIQYIICTSGLFPSRE